MERVNTYVTLICGFRLNTSYTILGFPDIVPARFDLLIQIIIKFFYQYGDILILCSIIDFHFPISRADSSPDVFADELLAHF